jgi:hypothetical protein
MTDDANAPKPPTTAHEIRAVAVLAARDPRTVAMAYAGRGKAVAVASVAAAAVSLGFAPPPMKENGK